MPWSKNLWMKISHIGSSGEYGIIYIFPANLDGTKSTTYISHFVLSSSHSFDFGWSWLIIQSTWCGEAEVSWIWYIHITVKISPTVLTLEFLGKDLLRVSQMRFACSTDSYLLTIEIFAYDYCHLLVCCFANGWISSFVARELIGVPSTNGNGKGRRLQFTPCLNSISCLADLFIFIYICVCSMVANYLSEQWNLQKQFGQRNISFNAAILWYRTWRRQTIFF